MIFLILYYLVGYALLTLIEYYGQDTVSLGDLTINILLALIWPLAVPLMGSLWLDHKIIFRRKK